MPISEDIARPIFNTATKVNIPQFEVPECAVQVRQCGS